MSTKNGLFLTESTVGDGNCFFRALSSEVNGSPNQHANLRHKVVNLMEQHQERFANFIDGSFPQHIENMKATTGQQTSWATDTEIFASATLLQCPIFVFSAFGKNMVWSMFYPLFNYPSVDRYHTYVMMANLSGQHYERVLHSNLKCNCKNEPPRLHCTHTSKAHKQRKLDLTQIKPTCDSKPQNKPTLCKGLNMNHNEQTYVDKSPDITTPSSSCPKKSRPTQHLEQTASLRKTKATDLRPYSKDKNTHKIIEKFEKSQMNYTLEECSVCHETKIKNKRHKDGLCNRCGKDKEDIPMFSSKNNMDPGKVPPELNNLTVAEQLLICRLSPCLNIYMKNHGGIASSGHSICFPQEINEPAQIFPRLPAEVNLLRMRKENSLTGEHKDFTVRRTKVEAALHYLKQNNPAFTDIMISDQRLLALPQNGPIHVKEISSSKKEAQDKGPAPGQFPEEKLEGLSSTSGMLLPEPKASIKEKIKNLVKNSISETASEKVDYVRGRPIVPWPTRGQLPVSEKTTMYFFTMAFPTLFPNGTGDFFSNRARTCTSLADWAQHLLWYRDGRFASHIMFKFIVHNMILRWRSLDQSKFYVSQQLGDPHISVSDLKERIENGDMSVVEKLLYFGASLRGTPQYWLQRSKELRALIQFKINEGSGLPSYFVTGSCAEFYFKPLRRILAVYLEKCSDKKSNLDNKTNLYNCLQQCSHIVAHYFQLRTEAYFSQVLKPIFRVDTFWYRFEFAKSRGMIHWHGLCWRNDRQPHQLLYDSIQAGQSETECAEDLSNWAEQELSMTALHPAGMDTNGSPKKDLWPPPEGTSECPPESSNPLHKLLSDVEQSTEILDQDHLLLVNRTMLHRCSEYCMRKPTSKQKKQMKLSPGEKVCRMEYPKTVQDSPSLVKDKNGALRLEMSRDHPNLVQHSKIHLQGWRANCDISLILSKSSPDNPSVNDIIACDRYETGYACKGNEGTESAVNLFKETINNDNEQDEISALSICAKTLNRTIGQRDISATEACYELSKLPLYQCSHQFLSISLKGIRQLETQGCTLTKSTPLDKYLGRPLENKQSWYDFMTKTHQKVPCISGPYSHPTWPLSEYYCRTVLLLHWPNWRALEEIKTNKTWRETMEAFCMTEHCPNYLLAQIEGAKRRANTPGNIGVDSTDEEDLPEQPDWVDLMSINPDCQPQEQGFTFNDGGPDHNWAQCSLEYPLNYGKSWVANLTEQHEKSKKIISKDLDLPEVEFVSLNNDQRFIFNLIINTLMQYVECSVDFKPLRLIVNGKAGAGNSFLIKCIVKAVRIIFNSNKTVQVITPTGNSANLIGGVTAHSFLKIPTGRKAFQELHVPAGKTGEILQDNCSELKVLIADEHSMYGRTMMGHMEHNMSHGITKATDVSWGGIPVVGLFGDFLQLPPVCDTPVYVKDYRNPASNHGLLVWKQFDCAANLNKPIRQKESEKEFRSAIEAIRLNKVDENQVQWLQKFQWNNLLKSHGSELLQKMDEQGVFIFPTHKAEWERNKQKISELNNKYPIAKVKAVNKGTHASKAGGNDAGGLANTIFLCKDAKVQLSCNLLVQYGLYNGAVGHIIDILYLDGYKTDCLPDVVMVEFPGYNGPPFLQASPKVLPIVPVERSLDCNCHCKRKQIPLRLAFGLTIHRVQGMTIGEGETFRYIVIDPGTKQFESCNPGALHVAVTRAKSAGDAQRAPDFAWNPSVLVNTDRLSHKVKTKTAIARSQEINRMDDLAKETRLKHKKMDTGKAFQTATEWIQKQIELSIEE